MRQEALASFGKGFLLLFVCVRANRSSPALQKLRRLPQADPPLPGDAGQILILRFLPPDAVALGGLDAHRARLRLDRANVSPQRIAGMRRLPHAEGAGMPQKAFEDRFFLFWFT